MAHAGQLEPITTKMIVRKMIEAEMSHVIVTNGPEAMAGSILLERRQAIGTTAPIRPAQKTDTAMARTSDRTTRGVL